MPEPDAARLSSLIVELRRLQRSSTAVQPDHPAHQRNLAMSHREVLGQVAAHPGTGTSAIAKALQLAPNTVSSIVSSLVREGLLRRVSDERDKRATRLYLTEQAAARRASRWDRRESAVEAALELLDPDDRAAIGAALPALQALRNAMISLRSEPVNESS